jgi:hypothetical protein
MDQIDGSMEKQILTNRGWEDMTGGLHAIRVGDVVRYLKIQRYLVIYAIEWAPGTEKIYGARLRKKEVARLEKMVQAGHFSVRTRRRL